MDNCLVHCCSTAAVLGRTKSFSFVNITFSASLSFNFFVWLILACIPFLFSSKLQFVLSFNLIQRRRIIIMMVCSLLRWRFIINIRIAIIRSTYKSQDEQHYIVLGKRLCICFGFIVVPRSCFSFPFGVPSSFLLPLHCQRVYFASSSKSIGLVGFCISVSVFAMFGCYLHHIWVFFFCVLNFEFRFN